MFLQGRVAIVTAGGGPGIGSAISRALAKEGAAVAIADIDAARAKSVADEIVAGGGKALAVPTDVSKRADVHMMVERVVKAFGKVSVLVNHAGVSPAGPIETMPEERWHRGIGVHLNGCFFCTQAVIPHMKRERWGRIVSTSSRAAYRASPNAYLRGLSDYAAAKAGIVGFSRAAAYELGPFGITVNVVAPGLVSGSGMAGEPVAMTQEQETQASQHEGQALRPLRYVKPEEIAGAVMYLVSPLAERVTGQVLHVNGGSYFNA